MSDHLPSLTIATLLCGVCLLLVHLHYKALAFSARSRGRPLPPGPRPLPLVSNLFDIPTQFPWRAYQEYSKHYGNIISFQAMGQTLVVIDDPEIAVDLLEKRSGIYSSRPDSIVVELTGWAWNFGFMPYGQGWRSRRRVVWQQFHPGVVGMFNDTLEESAQVFLMRLLSGSPEELRDNVRYSVGTTLLKVAYGLQTMETDDKYISTFDEAIKSLDLLMPGTTFIEFFPVLARFPTWFPGMGVLRRMANHRRVVTEIPDNTWNDAKSAASSGNAPASSASALIAQLSRLDGEEMPRRQSAGRRLPWPGIDTTHASICAFFLAMSLYPDVQKKAREELDAVVGSTRLPKLGNRANLPYINAIVKETLRWHTVTPMDIPHASTEDDEYDGFFIPEGSIVMVNAWSILHDPARYPQPEEFVPTRFIKNGILNLEAGDPAHIVFGFGRRICPGRYFAEAALFIYIASVLHTLDISPPLDEDGRPIRIEPQPTSELVTHLEDCRCNVKPRSAWAEALARGTE
ncbi:CyP450 monooxygenase [Lentinus brumalis]|uniref:CyP450 monooxygenase n=1 Tax=Lentinus brumalis TaxID=2498619 RepID=A0A371DHT6_9APHY|nr:CyP450 monooxygenase [Polyporus brumalis]